MLIKRNQYLENIRRFLLGLSWFIKFAKAVGKIVICGNN